MSMPGPMELVLILLLLVLLFGARKLPELGSGIGKGWRNFMDGLSGKNADNKPAEKLDKGCCGHDAGEDKKS